MAQARVDVIRDRSASMQKMLPYWELVDDLNDGIDAMIAAGEKYLKKFPHEAPEDYAFRLSNGKMTNIFSDIMESLSSKPYEKPVTLQGEGYPAEVEAFIKDVDGAGSSLTMFSTDVFEAGIRCAIDWIFIDYPDTSDKPSVLSVDEKRKSNIRPYWSRILATNVRDAKTRMFNGDERLSYFRYLEPGVDGEKDRVRVIEIDDNGVVVWKMYEDGGKYDENTRTSFVLVKQGMMSIDEVPVVPFVTGRRVGRTFELKPPMKAAADAQRSLYRDESALNHAKSLSAFPMLSASGVKPPKDDAGNVISLATGPGRVLYAPPDGSGNVGSFKYIEPNANSLMFLAKDIERDTQNLRELGRQPLTAQSENLTTVTTAVAAGKAKSSVSAWAERLRHSLTRALEITAKWEKWELSRDIDVFVYTDFDTDASGEMLSALLTAREKREISRETFWTEAKRYGLLSPKFDPIKETKALLDEVLPEDVNDDLKEG